MGVLRERVQALAADIKALALTHGAHDVQVFGSVSRGDDGPASDVDLLVDFGPDASILDLVHLELDLRALLGCNVDVVARGGLKPRDRHLLDEAVAL